ncbi:MULTISPECIES: ABC-F family ATP-binding cassette domain-containing protein [unclassified Candidatus Nanosynbacter]|uniref:ABC-F family ATP-binding cassette domain-containing protein n=1 Tax=unclassified Candidatus Nanosynbacter TaxID=2725944 RepID=UPI001FB630D0|nr:MULTISPECIES: ATP-binding cassette domain-containing protein [unclassified Candidatus Nanosynbacter]MCJ1963203.1 ATP-binding cassette domain-containing protein [Candidatus Nanosynbacter sp. TM7-033]UOG67692.1 ATP-binding cassette domain-containing protein [Candidatus Nanosynbacter sp. HMT-352]
MIADIHITEKSFGDKTLMKDVKFSVDDGEKVGVVGRNGVGKSTLFGILSGKDTDYTGEVIFRRGITVATTAQEHHGLGEQTVMSYILGGLPEYSKLKKIIDEYPLTMGDNMRKIEEYTQALERFDQKGFYQVEEKIERELSNFQLDGYGNRRISSLSGGQKRLVEIVKIMHSEAHLALIDEPTNHMDYVAKQQFIDWMNSQPHQAMLIITHDRDVLGQVDRIVEIKDGQAVSYRGNYDAYLKQNAQATTAGMNNFEQIEKRIVNLKQKVLDYQRLKEKSRNPGTIQKFKRLENEARAELAELSEMEKPTFWIDKESVGQLDYKSAERYGKFKSRNIRLNMKDASSRSQHVLVRAENVAVGIGERILFEDVNIDLREGEAIEIRGRNGAGKTTLIRMILASGKSFDGGPILYSGDIFLDPQVRIGVYEQEIDERYLSDPLEKAIEKLYMSRDLSISDTKIRQLLADYLFTDADRMTPLARLSGGQKARFQIIAMLANDPQLLVLDEPTNHLDLPSIEELETALVKYSGAILYVSHDNYFREKLGGKVVQIGAE